ncbi:MAG: glycine oxidase ThiO [Proteobacteria bacterium]|nr:glycine oxidase ThiO [Pseudomonadota bacterium]NOG61617.1 glycine oxidase ThiO [Pseudomonadota bacterium]
MGKTDYIIIGGGIVGLMTARELSNQGASVAIFERNKTGMESSWAAGGILSAMRPWAESTSSVLLSEQGKKLYPDYAQSLLDETGIDSEYIKSGLIISDREHAEKTRVWARNGNIRLVEDIENNSDNINLPDYSLLLPDIAQVRPPRLIKALRLSLENSPVVIYENTEITNILLKNKQFQGVEFIGGKVIADSVIISAGAWSKQILGNIGAEIKIQPIRGQIVCVKSKEKILNNIILEDAHYLMPRKDGHILIGSTMEDVGFNNGTTKVARKELLDWAYTVIPDLNKAVPVYHWSGLRPSTASNKPIIGQMPGFRNIYLNTGHFRKGILQAPSSAKLLVDTLSGKKSFMDIENFNLEIAEKSLESV